MPAREFQSAFRRGFPHLVALVTNPSICFLELYNSWVPSSNCSGAFLVNLSSYWWWSDVRETGHSGSDFTALPMLNSTHA